MSASSKCRYDRQSTRTTFSNTSWTCNPQIVLEEVREQRLDLKDPLTRLKNIWRHSLRNRFPKQPKPFAATLRIFQGASEPEAPPWSELLTHDQIEPERQTSSIRCSITTCQAVSRSFSPRITASACFSRTCCRLLSTWTDGARVPARPRCSLRCIRDRRSTSRPASSRPC